MNTLMTRLVFALFTLLLLADQTQAIPAFARKYDMTCGTCHQPFPKLKPYGDEFAGNGFQLSDKEAPRFFRETGDDQLLLMRELPLALRLEGFARWQPQAGGRTDFGWPYLLKLLSGGQIAKDVAYYFYFFFGERGEVAGLEDAFVMFNDIFKTDLDLYVGQFQVSDPLFKRELRLTLEDYQIYRVKVGKASPNLAYDRGVMLTYGLGKGTDLIVEVVNGNGLGTMDATRSFDSDGYKNYFLRISHDASDHVRVGGLGYVGKEQQTGGFNRVWMAGSDFTLALPQIELNAQYLERSDDNPFFQQKAVEVKTRGVLAEIVYTPDQDNSSWYGVALYNWVESPLIGYKYSTATGHVSYMLARNLRLVGEYTYDFHAEANKLTVGFVGAF